MPQTEQGMKNLLGLSETNSQPDLVSHSNPKEVFRDFFFDIFSLAIYRVHNVFIFGEHLVEWSLILQGYNKTSIVSARKHLKSTIAMAYIAWRIYKLDRRLEEWIYMSFTQDLAQHLISDLKRYMDSIPEYYPKIKYLTDAQSIIHLMNNGGEFICEPDGITAFKRGRHPYGMILDDILKDPTQKLDTQIIRNITTAFNEEIESMPMFELHLFGTPQDQTDVFAEVEKKKDFFSKRYPAEDAVTGKVLWKESFPKDKLDRIKLSIGVKAYCKEYLCSPVRSEEAFFKEKRLAELTIKRFKGFNILRQRTFKLEAVGGFDIGKKTHPSHLAIFCPDRKGRLVEVHSKWMDGWDYTDQVDYIEQCKKMFNWQLMYYDDTRAEFEGFREQGQLPYGMRGITFGSKNKFTMAAKFDTLVSSGKILFCDDERQRRQLLNVDNDLKAVATNEGHGDCFFSICLAVEAFYDSQGVGVLTL